MLSSKRGSLVSQPYDIPRPSTGSSLSNINFKQWHQVMQNEHEAMRESGKRSFGVWKWCFTLCKPCRWFDSIDYNTKICKVCMKFKTCKLMGTILVMATFLYILIYSLLKDELLPGGTVFFMFILFFASYVSGYIFMFIGIPAMFGNLLVGIIFKNLPSYWLPNFDKHRLETFTVAFEKFLLIIALIRAGLLLDLSRIKGRIRFIIRISLFPLLSEFVCVILADHYLLDVPWDWCALQGTVLCIVSLATITSVMEKNKQSGYGENIQLSTVLIAASVSDVIFGIFLYVICLSYLFPRGDTRSTGWRIIIDILEQVLIGLSVGGTSGLLIAFFPDKRNTEAAVIRIVLLGVGTFAIASILHEFNMAAAGVLGALITILVAGNMWEELGWHDKTNPVQYFYTMAYYFTQPLVLSLVGFSMEFTQSKEIGYSCAIIFIGLLGREAMCLVCTLGNLYPTTIKEKLFICLAWVSKGTFQVLLAFMEGFMTLESIKQKGEDILTQHLQYSQSIKQATVLAVLLTTPFACYALTLLTPVLLKKKREFPELGQNQGLPTTNPARMRMDIENED